jgi:hypothetical protein
MLLLDASSTNTSPDSPNDQVSPGFSIPFQIVLFDAPFNNWTQRVTLAESLFEIVTVLTLFCPATGAGTSVTCPDVQVPSCEFVIAATAMIKVPSS